MRPLSLWVVITVSLLLATWPASAQDPVPTFEVASVKPNTSGLNIGPGALSVGVQPGGRFTMTDGTVLVLIRSAFPNSSEVIGTPAWVSSEYYDVQAKAAGEPSREQMALMLRALLSDRFQFVGREELRERQTYALMIARADGRLSPGLRRYAVDCPRSPSAGRAAADKLELPAPSNGAPACGYMVGGNRILAGGITMERFAAALRGQAGREVIDKSGLAGDYEFTLDTGNDVSVFTALREQLGLKLEPERNAVPVVIVERIERPTPD
jgi:uncharacterized protein (TIGR03435 family)